jgi:transcriptional regulator GlxA family with amidase domain
VAGALAQRYPRVQVDADAIYVCDEIKDSDGMRQLWTSAGVTAGIDLALAVVEHDFGHALALQVARDLVMYLKRPAGSRSSAYPWPQATQHSAVQAAQQWVLEHLDQPMPLALLAGKAAMSERNFRRVFQQETGCSPSSFVENARLERAKQLLENLGSVPSRPWPPRSGWARSRRCDICSCASWVSHLSLTGSGSGTEGRC